MKSYSIIVEGEDYSTIFLKYEKEIQESSSVLIQVFSGESLPKFKAVLKYLKTHFPHATLIASSTDGEISNQKVLTESTVVSVSLFQKTQLDATYIPQEDSFAMGVKLAQTIITPRTKLLITFTDGISSNGEEFLNGIYSVAPHVIIAGGLSADGAKFENCYVGKDDTLYSNGAVGVALDSDFLQVDSLYSFGWESIGVEHIITKAKGNRVYTICNKTAVEFYTNYLGTEIAEALPATGIEFPLIMNKDGVEVARAVTAKHDDGSLSFAGNIKEGEVVHLGIGEVSHILENSLNKSSFYVESFFIYSCMARRRFIPDLIYQEIEPFAKVAPTSGFFTYGEFFTSKKPELLNQTLTAVALSESKEQKQIVQKPTTETLDIKDKTLAALMNIINVTTKELHRESEELTQIKKELEAKTNTMTLIQEMAHLGSWELDLETKQISWSVQSYKIHNYDLAAPPPTLEEFIDMVVPEDRIKLSKLETLANGPKNENVHSIEIHMQRNDGKILTLLESGKLIYNEKNEAVKMVGTTLDITDIRIKDAILSQQAKLAQMGEMINMIAHQWRQPLNAISASAIKLNMLNEMGAASSEHISKTATFIESMTQVMSQTINDFINFTKPNTQKELILFENLLDDILKIMGTQLTNHNIELRIDIEPNLSTVTYKKELEHVLINIIANARDALDNVEHENKYITIKMYSRNQRCMIEISDNAGGIDEEIIERIFEPYFTTKDTNKGTGLGLYMSKKIVKEHLDGELCAKNIKDGAMFRINIGQCNE